MIRSILFVSQVLLFVVLFALGSVFLPLLPFLPVLQVQTGPGRLFVYDGILLAIAGWVVILLLQTMRKTLRTSGLLTTIALLVAVGLGLLMRFGFKSV